MGICICDILPSLIASSLILDSQEVHSTEPLAPRAGLGEFQYVFQWDPKWERQWERQNLTLHPDNIVGTFKPELEATGTTSTSFSPPWSGRFSMVCLAVTRPGYRGREFERHNYRETSSLTCELASIDFPSKRFEHCLKP